MTLYTILPPEPNLFCLGPAQAEGETAAQAIQQWLAALPDLERAAAGQEWAVAAPNKVAGLDGVWQAAGRDNAGPITVVRTARLKKKE